MKRYVVSGHGFVLSASLSLLLLQGVHIARADAPTAAAEEGTALEEIVVTAQKREQSAQDVGISIAAFRGDQLRQAGVTGLPDIADKVPALRIESPGPVNGTLNIRGVASRDIGPHVEGAVVQFRDGAYVSFPGATTAPMFDLDRVEVEKGPQGTLFGRNATGGLIQVISKPPTDTFDAYAQVTAGNFKEKGFEGAIGGPLTQSLSARLSLYANSHDGYFENSIGANQEAAKNYSARAQLLFRPGDDFSVLLNVHGSNFRPSASRGYPNDPLVQFPNQYARAPASAAEFAAFCKSSFAIAPLMGYTLAPPGSDQHGNCFYAGSSDPFKVTSNPTNYDNKWSGVTATVNWRITPQVWLDSISDYQHFNMDYSSDVDGSPYELFHFGQSARAWQASQEVRLSGTSDALRWVTGVYYLKIDGNYGGVFDLLNNPFLLASFNSPYQQETESYSGFVHGEYDLASQWTLVAGARWTEDKKHLTQAPSTCTGNPVFGFVPPTFAPICDFYRFVVFPNSLTFAGYDHGFSKGDWAGKLELDWKAAHGLLVYAGINRGTKAGGFNAGPGQLVDVANVEYKGEELTDYEGGFKWTTADQRARLNGAVFYYSYKNYQTYAVSSAGTLSAFNVDAHLKGAEFDFETRPVAGVTFQLGASWLDSLQKNVPSPTGGVNDYVIPDAPRWSGHALARYDLALPAGIFGLQADGAYVTSRTTDAVDTPALALPAYFRANASLDFASAKGGWTASLWCKNLTDKAVINLKTNLAPLVGGVEVIYEAPRTYGLTVGYRWQ